MIENRSFQLKTTLSSLVLLMSLFQFSCTKQAVNPPEQTYPVSDKKNAPEVALDSVTQNLKKIAVSFRFAASLEREILKTIRPDLNIPMTQFEIISTILDQRVGVKKNFGIVDCKLYNIQESSKTYLIFKQCQNPQSLIAELDTKIANQITVRFFTKEWSSVIGQSVTLTAPDRVCTLNIEDEKLKRLSCENTALALDQSLEVQELRLKEFVFDQKAEFQVQVSGGFYKNLVEHRKLNMKIPFDGKIKIIEKELKVRDDFANMENPPKTETVKTQTPEVSDGQKSNEKNSEKSSEENNEKSSEKINEENNGEKSGQEKIEQKDHVERGR